MGEQGRRASRTSDREGIATTADGGDESATTRDRSRGRTGWCGRLRSSLKNLITFKKFTYNHRIIMHAGLRNVILKLALL
jgi:hypothetical protein